MNRCLPAQHRTANLTINDRNTRQIPQTTSLLAADLLAADGQDDDGIPLLKPISCGRDGQAPLIIRLPSLRDEAFKIADLLSAAHQEGHAWGDMAVICRDWATMDICAHALQQRMLPQQVRKRSGDDHPSRDTITMHVFKGLEFAVVAIPAQGRCLLPVRTSMRRRGCFM